MLLVALIVCLFVPFLPAGILSSGISNYLVLDYTSNARMSNSLSIGHGAHRSSLTVLCSPLLSSVSNPPPPPPLFFFLSCVSVLCKLLLSHLMLLVCALIAALALIRCSLLGASSLAAHHSSAPISWMEKQIGSCDALLLLHSRCVAACVCL